MPTLSVAEPAPPRPAALGVFPRPLSDDVNPATPVSVAAYSGTIHDVKMVNDNGARIPGALTPRQEEAGVRPNSSSTGAPTP